MTRVRDTLTVAGLYGASAARILPRRGRSLTTSPDERLVFVAGSPRSGTTFTAEAIGSAPGFVDLGEVAPLKAIVPELVGRPEEEAAARIRHVLENLRRLALVRGLRGVEQTPELAFLLPAALRAYPEGRAVHVVRDGRDVVCSLLERGWLRAGRAGSDDARLPYGAQRRFWVERERVEEFERASDAARAAWAWRAYVTAARTSTERTLELRYERLAADPEAAAELVGSHLGIAREPLASAFSKAHGHSIGRYRQDLTAAQLEDVEREAGTLLRALGYSQPETGG